MLQDFIQIECGEMVTIAQVSELYAKFALAFEEKKTVIIDVSKVKRVDTAAIQLLYCFHQDATSVKMITIWSKPSQPLSDAVTMLGLPLFFVSQ